MNAEPDLIFHDMESRFAELQAEALVIEPVAAVARRVARTHPTAIASGGPRVVVRRSLELAGLAPLFRVVVSADDVVHGKPAPDIFLLAAKQMGVAAERCLVFEDAEPAKKLARRSVAFLRRDRRRLRGESVRAAE